MASFCTYTQETTASLQFATNMPFVLCILFACYMQLLLALLLGPHSGKTTVGALTSSELSLICLLRRISSISSKNLFRSKFFQRSQEYCRRLE